jgi:type II secretory pathway component HofQ
VLSALSEQVSDKAFSKVPLAGEVPVLNWFTRRAG